MYNIRVCITQAEIKIISAIALKYPKGGFTVKHVTVTPGVQSKKDCYRVNWTGRYALPFLEDIKDHVIVKRTQVLAAIEIAKLVSQRWGRGGDDRKYSQEEFDRREELGLAICRANGKKV